MNRIPAKGAFRWALEHDKNPIFAPIEDSWPKLLKKGNTMGHETILAIIRALGQPIRNAAAQIPTAVIATMVGVHFASLPYRFDHSSMPYLDAGILVVGSPRTARLS
ncbi:hypothetical protein [Martelella sp. FOR1707]